MKTENEVGYCAEYLPQMLEEYGGNPFIEALPPILSAVDAADALSVKPSYNEAERKMDAAYRFHAVQRLLHYFQPLYTHIDIDQRISRSIRQGYLSRNPVKPQYVQRLRQCGEAVEKRSFEAADFRSVKSTALGFTVIGMSGVGKTTAMERVLSLYPQCITHTEYAGQPMYLKQLVWLKLDCPFDGSIKGLCVSFFSEVDRILQSTYSQKFYVGKNTVDMMLPKMAQIASTHGVGLLVIDEIQHLSQAKSGGSEKMLNFFVTLVNTIGIPVILIGTTKALPILQSEFRQARRGSGQGDLLWDRMKNDMSWEILIHIMWKYQWTKEKCLFTEDMKNILYDESQGIIDIAVKLYAMAQIKVITDETERITSSVIREVAAEKLSLVRPMLNALRSGDMKKIMQFEDIRPVSIEDYISAQASRLPMGELHNQKVSSLEEQVIIKLLELDISPKTARACAKKALSGRRSGQPLSHAVQRAFKLALNIQTAPAQEAEPDADDLRNADGIDPYEGLKEAGIIAGDSEEW